MNQLELRTYYQPSVHNNLSHAHTGSNAYPALIFIKAPRRDPDQLFIGIQQISEKNFYTYRDWVVFF